MRRSQFKPVIGGCVKASYRSGGRTRVVDNVDAFRERMKNPQATEEKKSGFWAKVKSLLFDAVPEIDVRPVREKDTDVLRPIAPVTE